MVVYGSSSSILTKRSLQRALAVLEMEVEQIKGSYDHFMGKTNPLQHF
jgi:hypothetical protein